MQGSMLGMNKNENRNFATTRTKPRERQRKEEQRELGTDMRRKSNEQQRKGMNVEAVLECRAMRESKEREARSGFALLGRGKRFFLLFL